MCDNSYTTIFLIKLSEWIRGSRSEHVRKILQTVPTSSTYGIGAPFNMSLEGWRKLLQAGWIIGLLERTMIQGAGESLGKSTAMNIFTASPHADAFLTEPKPVLLPKLKDTLDLANMCWNLRPDNFIQIVNISNSHWVCVSNINCPPAVVDVYDTMYPSPPYTLKEQVATILRSPEKKITL